MNHKAREVQIKLMRGLLDLVVLQYLRAHPVHGYKIIASLRKNFGVYFGPSTIYPLLSTLEGNGYIKSQWDLQNERPRKVYSITPQGLDLLFNRNRQNRNQRQPPRINSEKQPKTIVKNPVPKIALRSLNFDLAFNKVGA